ncbi:MAG TPA: hypothetical protein VI776_00660, partial [Anaerolineales bacterium]|nr:hypothetical protein [Anaerolineales bacterium]
DNFRVQKFNSGLFYRRTFGVTGLPYLTDAKHYNQPVDVAVDANGNIGILEDDGRGQRFTKLNASGVPQFTLGVAGVWGDDNQHFADPRGVTFDASGDIYVADCANHRLQIFAGNGAYQATFGGPGSGQYQFSCPTGVAFDAGGNMYVADSTNQRIQIYDSNRTYVATLGKTGVSGTDKYHFKWPQDVEVDAGGNIFVADLFNERVLKYNSSRVWQMTLGTTGESGCSEADHLCAPFGVAVDASGNIYVVQKFGPGVRVFSQNGDELATIGATWGSGNNQVREPQGIEVDADGNVYIADTLNHRVLKFVPGIPVYIPIALDTYP